MQSAIGVGVFKRNISKGSLWNGVGSGLTARFSSGGSTARSCRRSTRHIRPTYTGITALRNLDTTNATISQKGLPAGPGDGDVRVDVVGKVLQRVSVQRRERRVVLGQFQALVVRVGIMLDFTVGDLGDVVQAVPARLTGQQGNVE